MEEEDLIRLHRGGRVSKYRRYEAWLEDFKRKLPSFQEGELSFTFVANREGKVRWQDGFRKHNPCIARCFRPFMTLIFREISRAFRAACCFSRKMNSCGRCVPAAVCLIPPGSAATVFSCIGLISQKSPEQLNVLEPPGCWTISCIS